MADATTTALDPPAALVALVGRERSTIVEALTARAQATPDATFISWREGGLRTWTYAEAVEQMWRVAGGMRALGVTPGARVASFLTTAPDTVWAWLGAQAAGAIWIPLNRRYQGELLHDQIVRARASVLVSDDEGLPLLEGLKLPATVVVTGAEPTDPTHVPFATLAASPPLAPEELDPGAIGLILMTSGSTGRSKKVLITNNQIVRSMSTFVSALQLTADDVLHVWASFFHAGGSLAVARATLAGAEIALYPGFSASRFWDQIRDSGATILNGFPVIMRILMDAPPSPADRDHRVRAAMVAGATPEMHRVARERFGFPLYDVFGSTETDLLLLNTAATPAPPGSCGTPNPDYELQLVDEVDRPVPDGEVGEIVVRPRVADLVFRGYEDDAEVTVRAWRNLWAHTGDLAYKDADGYFWFVGRTKDRIRRRGENISAYEVEESVLRHEAIAECVAVAVPSEMGEDEVKVAIVLAAGAELTPHELREWCLGCMPRFMVPRFYELMDELPRLPAGKVDKLALREPSPATVDTDPPRAAR